MPYFHSSGWPRRFAVDGVGRAQPRIAIEQPAAEPLEADGVVDGQAEVPQLDLAVGADQRQRPRDGAPVVVLLGQAMGFLFGVGEAGDEGDPRGPAGRQPHELTQRHDRVEDRRRSCSTAGRRSPARSDWPSVRPRPTKRARLVSYCVAGPTRPRPLSMCKQVGPSAARCAAGGRRSARHARAAPRSR